MTANMPGPHISPQLQDPAPLPPRRVIPTSWSAPLPVNVLIDGRPVTPSSYDEAPYVEPYASPLPLDVQYRLDDGQAITVELYEGPLKDQSLVTSFSLIHSPIDLDENQPLSTAMTETSPLLVDDSVNSGFVVDFLAKTRPLIMASKPKLSSVVKPTIEEAGNQSFISVVDRLPGD